MKRTSLFSSVLIFGGLAALLLAWQPKESFAASQLIKGESNSAVYELYGGKRYAFPNEKVFFTWHSNFSEVQTVSDSALANTSLGGNVTYRPGVKMIKIISDPKVYAVAANATLRWITTEVLARAYYGDRWQQEVHDVSDAFFVNYSVGNAIENVADFNPVGEMNTSQVFVPPMGSTATSPQSVPPVAQIPTPAPSPQPSQPISLCGNGKIDAQEECDGGQRCTSLCKLTTIYPSVNYSAVGGYSDYSVGIGDKIAIGDGINLRIDDIISQRVRYSIWGKDNAQACKLISASGVFTLDTGYNFREFTDSFFEVTGINSEKIALRQWYGNSARVRCEALAGWKKPLACSFYQTDDHAYVPHGNFQTFYFGTQARLGAEYYAEAFNGCYQRYLNKIPQLASILPIGRQHWDVYETIDPVNAYSTDYQRIFVSKDNFEAPASSLQQKFAWTQGGRCPVEESAVAHELAHLLFSRTFLQDIYDGGYKTEWADTSVIHEGSVTPSEGFAQFMSHYVTKDMPDAAGVQDRAFWGAFCGKDHLINAHPDGGWSFTEATEQQMRYSEVLSGRGFQANHYPAGYCFYKRIDDDCGDTAINNLLTKAIQYDGSMASHPTMFRYLADSCGEEKVKTIMTDFGFDSALLTMTQRWPNVDFPNNLNQLGCK